MQKLFTSIGAIIGVSLLIGGAYSMLINVRKAEISYILAPNFLKKEAINAKARFPTSTTFSTLYIRTSDNSCKWLNRNDFTSGRLKYMPSSVAIALAKLRYSQIIKNCLGSLDKQANSIVCTKQLDVAINRHPDWASPQIDYLFPDDAAALNKLGVKTNKVLVVESIQDLEYRKKIAAGHR